MLVGGSSLLLGLSVAGLTFFGLGSSSVVSDGLLLMGVVSAFLVICLTEARQAS